MPISEPTFRFMAWMVFTAFAKTDLLPSKASGEWRSSHFAKTASNSFWVVMRGGSILKPLVAGMWVRKPPCHRPRVRMSVTVRERYPTRR